jgi:hypothetical protein
MKSILARATLLLLVLTVPSRRLTAGDLKIDAADGGSVVTDLGHGIQVNKGSSLHRSFVTINDVTAPVQLQDTGVTVSFSSELSRYSFTRGGRVSAAEALSAFEVRHVLFGMFGEWIRTVSGQEVVDVEKASSFDLHEESAWTADETQVSRLLTVVSFVANARTTSGRVWHSDTKRISDAIAQLNLSLGSESSLH